MTRTSPQLALIAAAFAAVLTTHSGAQPIPDFSGTWVLLAARSGSPVDVWGQTRPHDRHHAVGE